MIIILEVYISYFIGMQKTIHQNKVQRIRSTSNSAQTTKFNTPRHSRYLMHSVRLVYITINMYPDVRHMIPQSGILDVPTKSLLTLLSHLRNVGDLSEVPKMLL